VSSADINHIHVNLETLAKDLKLHATRDKVQNTQPFTVGQTTES